MAKKTAPLLPATDELLRRFGDRLRLARRRRRLSAKQVAERAGMSPMTLRSLERGGSGVTMGAYLAVMQVLGIDKDLDLLGKADPVGRELQDAQLQAHAKMTRPSLSPSAKRPATAKRPVPVAAVTAELRRAIKNSPQEQLRKLKPSEDARNWIKKSGFASADALADLIDPLESLKKKVR
jgi:transcriptional regulator with XRE-family HTH domain